jgi:hypothetical protein
MLFDDSDMRKRLFLVLFCLMLPTCGPSIDTLIPASRLDGTLPNLQIETSEQTGKSVKGGRLLVSSVAVPYDMRSDQVKPTLLSIIKQIKQKDPSCEWIVVYLVPVDAALPLLQAGIGTYKEGRIELRTGIPSDKDLADYNALRGSLGAEHYPPLTRPDNATFELGRKVLLSFIANKEKLILEGRMRDVESADLAVFPHVSRDTGISFREARRVYHQLMSYYVPAWGVETIGGENK